MNHPAYEILKGLPGYGPMYISIPPNNYNVYSEGFVVRFYKKDGSEWVGNFQLGFTQLKEVIELEESPNLLVIAGGICYSMDPESEKPLDMFRADYKYILRSSDNRIVMSTPCELTIIETDGTYWHSERFALDGIENLQIENSIVKGTVSEPVEGYEEWVDVEFTYDIDTKILTGASFFSLLNQLSLGGSSGE